MDSARGPDLAPISLYLSQSEKLSKIKPSLVILVRINAHLISSDVQSNIERKSKVCIFSVRFNQSLYRSHAGRHFYETENEIWAKVFPEGWAVTV